MRLEQCVWTRRDGWGGSPPALLGDTAQLALVFASNDVLRDGSALADVMAAYPRALLFGCSTAGEICDAQVHEESLVVTAVAFESVTLESATIVLTEGCDSFGAGQQLARRLPTEGLVHALVLSEGLNINGSDLVRGLTETLPDHVTATGGLSGDGAGFTETYVLVDGKPLRDAVAVVGLYGERLRVGYGSLGGWDPFGPERVITRSAGNVLYELDGRSALDLYKSYLGDQAEGLPASGLLFPLSVRSGDSNGDDGVVRTILAVDEAEHSMTFAGDIPEGAYARLMKANFDRLIDGAVGAARTSYAASGSVEPQLALLISCVGRKLVLGQRVEEELEGVRDVLGSGTVMAGFYSYGEISPFTPGARCTLHNQTMTITTLSEL
jgi:hypothetical protein